MTIEGFNWFYERAKHALAACVGFETSIPVKIERQKRAIYLPEGFNSAIMPLLRAPRFPAIAQVLALKL
jgi:hypothetical protein